MANSLGIKKFHAKKNYHLIRDKNEKLEISNI